MIIVIDGPAGSGKSTAAKRIAERLGGEYLDTGAMYRALTLKALRLGVHLEDERGLERLAAETQLTFERDADGHQRILLDQEDVSEEIRSPRVNDAVSVVSAVAPIRHAMVALQQQIGYDARDRGIDLIAEGRDMGTVVFPGADAKFYLTASPRERARRRYNDMVSLGHELDIESIEESISQRDSLDSNREVSPLRRADDAIPIDTTDLGPEQVVDEVLKRCGKLIG